MRKGKHRKHDKPFYLRWPGKWPFKYIWMLWNPFGFIDYKYRIIPDLYQKAQGKKRSEKERERRKSKGLGENLCFNCRVVRTLDFSGRSS
jgi:hypothetical protein